MILIVSRDGDFSSTIAEKLQEELKLDCRVAEHTRDLSGGVDCIVTSEALAEGLGVPVVAVRNPPVRMYDVLRDVHSALASADESMEIGSYRFSPRQKKLTRESGADEVTLTDKETQLIRTLVAAGKEGISKESLLKSVWGFESSMDTHTLETHIYRLRAKLKTLGEEQAIAAMDGGYVLRLK